MPDGIQLSEALAGNGAAIFRHACGMGVSKRISSRYLSGRTRAWLEAPAPANSFCERQPQGRKPSDRSSPAAGDSDTMLSWCPYAVCG
jgi:hypothetical protein